MAFFLIGLVIGVVIFITIELIIRKRNKKKAINSDIDKIEDFSIEEQRKEK